MAGVAFDRGDSAERADRDFVIAHFFRNFTVALLSDIASA